MRLISAGSLVRAESGPVFNFRFQVSGWENKHLLHCRAAAPAANSRSDAVISLEDIFAIYARLSISLPCDSIRDLIIATWIRPNRPVRRLLSRAAESSSNAAQFRAPWPM